MKHYIDSRMKYTAVALACLLIVVSSLLGNTSAALATGPNPTAPNLGEAGRFVILASQTITNTTGSLGDSAISKGDLGITDQARSYYHGFTTLGSQGGFAELTNGLSYGTDDVNPSPFPYPLHYATPVVGQQWTTTAAMLTQSKTDLGVAYTFLGATNPTAATQVCPTQLATQVLTPGVYATASNVAITGGDLTLDAQSNANAVWIFSIGGTLTTGAPGGNIILANGAQAKNVYWRVAGNGTAGTAIASVAGTHFYGNVLSWDQIAVSDGVNITGRLYSVTAQVTLIGDTITMPVQSAPSATGVTINSPISVSPAYTHATGGTGSVLVTYSLTGPGSDSNNVSIQIISGSTVAGTASTTQTSNTTGDTITVPILASAQTGTYDVVIQDGNGHNYTASSSVSISNTLPTATVSIPNSGSGWSAVASPVTQNTLSFATSELCTVSVYLTVNNGTGILINSLVTPTIPIGSPMSSTYYTGTFPSNSSLLTGGISGLITINATDLYGNAGGTITPQSFSLSSAGPGASVTTPGTSGAVYSGGTISSITGSVLPYTTGSTASYQIGLFNSTTATSQVTNPPGLVDLISGGWQSGTVTNGSCPISYSWHVENNVSGSSFYIGIQGKDSVGTTGNWAFSQYPFRILDVVKPTVTIQWPSSGSVHYAGAADNVTWTMTDNVPGNLTYNLWLSINGGSTFPYLIAASNHAQGTWWVLPWQIPGGISSTNCVITENVSDNENPANVQTVRSNNFSIVSAVQPTATISAPIGGENWAVGNTQSITWTQADTSSSQARLSDNISFSGDGGSTWVVIATLTNMAQSSNTYSWAVPDPIQLSAAWPDVNPSSTTTAPNCRISITALNPFSGLSVTTSSPSPFTISPGTSTVTTDNVSLVTGWNLVSLPLVPTNSNIQNVLGSSINSIASVWTCSGGGTTGGSWSSYAPGSPSSLTTMVDGKAYWINANSPTIFTFQGRYGNPPPSAPPTYSEPAGWNMVGLKSTIPVMVSSYLGTATGANGASTYSLPITGYSGGGFTTLQGTGFMQPGQGYWVYYNTAGVIAPPSQ